MALLGKKFERYVDKQIKIRQKYLGGGYSAGREDGEVSKEFANIVYNQNAPWMRLTSAVSITEGTDLISGDSVYKQIEDSGIFAGFDWKNDSLSKNFCLLGGAASLTQNKSGSIDNANLPSGIIGPDNPDVSNQALKAAYGFGYTQTQANSGRGYVPPPGVTEVNFEYKNDGALAFAEVKIKAFSEVQFAIIDVLFQRPGYTCLLEFGHSRYIRNSSELNEIVEDVVSTNFYTKPFDFLVNGENDDLTFLDLAKKIREQKELSSGNYEGFFGKITKFNWSFNKDGSYDITVKLTGTGDIIQSLTTNSPIVLYDNDGFPDHAFKYGNGTRYKPTDSKLQKAGKTQGVAIVSEAIKSQLNFELYQFLSNKKEFPSENGGSGNSSMSTWYPGQGIPLGDMYFGSNGKYKGYTIGYDNAVYKVDLNDYGGWGNLYPELVLIKFGVFMCLLQKICNLKDSKNQYALNFRMVDDLLRGTKDAIDHKEDDFSDPYFDKVWPLEEFNFGGKGIAYINSRYDETFYITYPGNFSSNPRICQVVPTSYDYNIFPDLPKTYKGNDLPGAFTETNGRFKRNSNAIPVKKECLPMVARLSDVYVDINFLAQTLKDLTGFNPENTNEVEIPILDYLKAVLSKVNTALGGINDFRVIFDETTQTVDIVNESPFMISDTRSRGDRRADEEFTVFNTFGLSSNEGSFVTDMDLKSELTDQFATQISVGAQANANTEGSEGGVFATYSKGLIDRLFVEKQNSLNPNPSAKTKEEIKKAQDLVINTWKKDGEVYKAYYQVYGDREFGDKYIPALENINVNLSKYIIGKYVQNGYVPPNIFLPFNLSLTMTGLGGLRIYDGFKINGRGLPISYNAKNILLIIKSLTHNVTVNGWTTKIQTISKPETKTENIPTGIKSTAAAAAGAAAGAAVAGSGNIPAPPPSKPPADEKTRIVLRRLADDGLQTYGIMTVLDANGKELYVLPTVELPWKGNQNSISCIPPNDTYRVKSHVSGRHGKCFWIIGNGQGGYKYDRLYGNGYVRSSVLIHKSPIAPGWLEGCIGPGLKFNKKQTMKDKFGGSNSNPLGTGGYYLNPSKAQSQQAVNKLLGTLYSEGSFLMKILNLNDVGAGQLPTSFNDPAVQNYINASPLRKKLIS